MHLSPCCLWAARCPLWCVFSSRLRGKTLMRSILITGAAGFIGSNFVRMLLRRNEDVKLVALDKLTYAGNLANLQDLLDDPRLAFVRGDICDAELVAELFHRHAIPEILNFARESPVDP